MDNFKQPVKWAAAHPWGEQLMRFGFAAKGVVYFVVGVLAAQAAFTSGGKTTDSSGALEEILIQPFGKFLLSLTTIGIIGYILWRFVQTILDPEHSGQNLNAKRFVQRVGYALSDFGSQYAEGAKETASELLNGNKASR